VSDRTLILGCAVNGSTIDSKKAVWLEMPRSQRKFDSHADAGNRRSSQRRRHSPDASTESRGTKIRVDNIHYELTQEDLEVGFEDLSVGEAPC
jgi:hypothetical protein